MEDRHWELKIRRLQEMQAAARQTGDSTEVRELEVEIQNAIAAQDRDRDRRAKGEIP